MLHNNFNKLYQKIISECIINTEISDIAKQDAEANRAQYIRRHKKFSQLQNEEKQKILNFSNLFFNTYNQTITKLSHLTTIVIPNIQRDIKNNRSLYGFNSDEFIKNTLQIIPLLKNLSSYSSALYNFILTCAEASLYCRNAAQMLQDGAKNYKLQNTTGNVYRNIQKVLNKAKESIEEYIKE